MAQNLVGAPIVFKKMLHDLLVWMTDNERNYCCTGIEVPNATGAAITVDIGTVITNAELADSATPAALQPAFTDALTLARVTIPANSERDVPCLVRGPALVNFNEVVRVSANESDAAVIVRLANLVSKNIRFVLEPANTSRPDLNG